MDLFGSPKKMTMRPIRKPAAVAPIATTEPTFLMPNTNNLLTVSPATPNRWHPNTGFIPNRKHNTNAAARRAATLQAYAAARIGASAAPGQGPSTAAAMSNMPTTPVQPRPRLAISPPPGANAGKSSRRAARSRAGNKSRKTRRT